MLKLKDLLEVIEEGSVLTIYDWSSENHVIVYNDIYHLEDLPNYDNYKVITLEQSLYHIIINIVKWGD